MSKYRVKGGGTPEVHSARSKLDGVLQTLVERKDESFLSDDEIKGIEPIDSVDTPTTPSKKSGPGRPQKKRKRKEDISPEMGEYHHSYVMKLFDRSVDLAQFEDGTPLYVMCRAWIKNEPHNKELSTRQRTPTPEPEEENEDDELGSVYSLPQPLPLPKSENNAYVDPRIPLSIVQPRKPTDFQVSPDVAPAPERLLVDHLNKWKLVRRKWRDAARLNEDRYSDSVNLLKAMYDGQCKE